eukprot:9353218-Ditylum_brightwellii.AAC.1
METSHPNVVKTLEQLPFCQEMDHLRTDEEAHKAISKLNNLAAGSLRIMAEIFKSLTTEVDTFTIMRKIVHEFWKNK